MKTLPDLLRQEAKGISALKEKIGEKLQTTSSFPIPSGCSCYGFYLAKDELTPPFNDIDTQRINIVVHKPEQEITCYPIQHARGEKIYAVSFDFSGCFMALFEQEGILYAAHITTSSDGKVDGRTAFQNLIGKEGTNYIVYNPYSGMKDHTAGIMEFTDFDKFHCYSFGQNNHLFIEKKVEKNDANALTKSVSQGKQSGCAIL